MTSPCPPAQDPVEALFTDLNAKEAGRREHATQRFESWPRATKFQLRCPLKKNHGWSVLAHVGRANVNASKWSRLRFEKLIRGASAADFNQRTAHDVPDGAWVWLGCMNAAAQDAGRRDRLHAFRNALERQWGPEDFFAGLVALRDALGHLEKPVKTAFHRAWRQEWDDRVQASGLNSEAKSRSFVKEWIAAAEQEPVPLLSFTGADQLAVSVLSHAHLWLEEPDALRAAGAILAAVQEPIGRDGALDLAGATVAAYRFPDRPVEGRYIAAWADINPAIAAHLAQMQAQRLAAELPEAPRPSPRLRL